MRIPPDYSTKQQSYDFWRIFGAWDQVDIYRYHFRHTTAADYGLDLLHQPSPGIFRLPKYCTERLGSLMLFKNPDGRVFASQANHYFLATFFRPSETRQQLVTTVHWVATDETYSDICRTASDLYIEGATVHRVIEVTTSQDRHTYEESISGLQFPLVVLRHVSSNMFDDYCNGYRFTPFLLESDYATYAPILEVHPYTLNEAQHIVLACTEINTDRMLDSVFAWRMQTARMFSRDPGYRFLPAGHRAVPPLAVSVSLDRTVSTDYELEPR